MKKIKAVDIFICFAGIGVCFFLVMLTIAAYQDTRSRIEWRKTTSSYNIEMVKREAIEEYIKQQQNETIHK